MVADKLLLATENKGKVMELKALLERLPFLLRTPFQEGIRLKVEETGVTFRENAVIKAVGYAQAGNLLALADDSGLEVDALGGEPGVRSARYAGEGATDDDRIALLLSKLQGVPQQKRTARFKSVIAVAFPSGQVETFDGSCEGRIAFDKLGSNGLGYDPVFLLSELGKRMAELSLEEKNLVSHRAQAAGKASAFLESWVKGRVV